MNCENFISAVETGGAFRRWTAHCHARRCANCAATLAMLDQVKASLAPSSGDSELPAHLRRRWMAVANAESLPAHHPTWSQPLWSRLAGGTLSVVSLVALVWLYHQHQTPKPGGSREVAHIDIVTVGPIIVARVDRALELSKFDAEIVQLQDSVSTLIQSAERLEAQQRIAFVLAQNTKW